MLIVSSPGSKADTHIRDGSPCEHTLVEPLLQMCEHQTLPAPIQHILTAYREKLQPAAPLSRLQNKMNLRIVAQRLKMAYPLHLVSNGFFI